MIRRIFTPFLTVLIILALPFTSSSDDVGNSTGYTDEELLNMPSSNSGRRNVTYTYLGSVTRFDELPPADGNEISKERISDGTIDFDELGTFINKFNSSVLEESASLANDEEELNYALARLYEEYDINKQLADDLEYDLGPESSQSVLAEYSTARTYEAAYRQAIKAYKESIKNLSGRSSVSNLQDIQRNQTKAAQSKFIAYVLDTLSEDVYSKSVELYETRYNLTQTSLGLGLATENDLLTIKSALDNAKASLNESQNNKANDYNDLLRILGLDSMAGYIIGEAPEADSNFCAGINKEADREQYINNNSLVKSTRRDSSVGTAEGNVKRKNLALAISEAGVAYDNLLSNLLQSNERFIAANEEKPSIETEWNLNEQRYSLGLISQSEYIEANLNYLEDSERYMSAKLELVNAINNYRWAVMGYVS